MKRDEMGNFFAGKELKVKTRFGFLSWLPVAKIHHCILHPYCYYKPQITGLKSLIRTFTDFHRHLKNTVVAKLFFFVQKFNFSP